jgi:hypothetical protein
MTTTPHYRSAGSQTPPTRFELPPGVIASEDIAHTAAAAHAPGHQRGQKPQGSAGVCPPRHTTADHHLFAQRSAPEMALDTPSRTNQKGFFSLQCRPTWGSLRRLPWSPRTYLLKVQWRQALGWLSRCGQEERTGKTGRWRRLPPLLRLAGAKRLLLYKSPRPAQVLRMRKRRPWSPGLPSSGESVRPSPRTTKRLGLWSSHITAYGTDTHPLFRALQMASTSESLRSTTRILCPTITPSAYSPTHITPLSKTSLLWADTLAHSPAPSWRPIWAHSRHLLSPLSPKHRSQANSGRCMTFCTPTTPCPTWLPSTLISTVMFSHAHGEPSPLSPCSLHAFPQVPRPLSAMLRRPTGLSPLPHHNGLASSSACKNMTSLQSIPATTLGSHWPVVSMAWLPMRGQTYSGVVASDLWQSGSTTTYFSGSHTQPYHSTTHSTKFGSAKYMPTEGVGRMAAGSGMEEKIYRMVPRRSLMKTAA